MRRTTLLLIALAVLLPLASAHAEDDTAPKAAFETVIAALPAPSTKHAFTFECEALMNGNPFGTITFKAEYRRMLVHIQNNLGAAGPGAIPSLPAEVAQGLRQMAVDKTWQGVAPGHTPDAHAREG